MDEPDGYDYTYVILGKGGPTGKTWLTNGLTQLGYRAIELSEYMYDDVEYIRDRNSFRIIEDQKCVVIILNKNIHKNV
jgi:hypothetical protein